MDGKRTKKPQLQILFCAETVKMRQRDLKATKNLQRQKSLQFESQLIHLLRVFMLSGEKNLKVKSDSNLGIFGFLRAH